MLRIHLPILALLLVTAAPASAGEETPPAKAPSTKAPSAKAAIGWHLFFDPLLSGPKSFSCASCHQPEKGFADGLPLARGVHGDLLPRHTPRIVDLAGAGLFFWDGRATSLEEQVLVPLTHPQEMDLAAEEAAARVAADPDYRRAFAAAGVEEVTVDEVAAALAAFVRSLESGNSRYDRWLGGDREALSPAEERGRMTFFTRGQCATCHIGAALTDHRFHNVATGTAEDPGRSEVTGEEKDQGKFKTPPLRGWGGSEPFMHDGRYATLAEVLDHYSEPPEAEVGTSELDPLELEEDKKADLAAFLQTLDAPGPDLMPYEERWRRLVETAREGRISATAVE